MPQKEMKYVGRSIARVDAVDKVTGRAKFTGDLNMPGMLHGKILRSPFPQARIRGIDASKAEALPGVAAVLTSKDIHAPRPIYGGRRVLALDKAPSTGEPVAAV